MPPALNFKKEEREIKKALRKSKLKILYQSKVATRDNFEKILRKEPKILHISCHGIRTEVRRMQANQEEAHEESHHLLFENSYGSGQLVSAKDIRLLMENSPHPIDLIFVAACDSEEIGKTFLRCGV